MKKALIIFGISLIGLFGFFSFQNPLKTVEQNVNRKTVSTVIDDNHILVTQNAFDKCGDGKSTDKKVKKDKASKDTKEMKCGGAEKPKEFNFMSADSNGDGKVSKSEFSASSAEQYAKTDKNKDGRVTEDECMMFSKFNKNGDDNISLDEFNAAHNDMFANLDKNKDGFVDSEEAAEMKPPAQGKCGEGKCGEGKCGAGKCGKADASEAKPSTHKCTKEEQAKCAKSPEKCTKEEKAKCAKDAPKGEQKCGDGNPMGFEQHFMSNDADKDGRVSFPEFEKHFTENYSTADKNKDGKVTEEECMMFSEFNTNGDNYVSVEEYKNGHKAMFAKMDKDGDGFVTEDECKASCAKPDSSAPQMKCEAGKCGEGKCGGAEKSETPAKSKGCSHK